MKQFIAGLVVGVVALASLATWHEAQTPYSEYYYELQDRGYNCTEAAYLCGAAWCPLYADGYYIEELN